MSTLHQLKAGLSQSWIALVEGWRKLYHQAAGAMTRFTQHGSSGELVKPAGDDDTGLRNVGWGVLAAEVFDDKDKVIVRLEVPGMEKGEFDIDVLGDYVVVRGVKKTSRENTKGRYHVMECAYGQFERAIALPDAVKPDGAKAKYRSGVLRIELPKVNSSKRKKVAVTVA